MRVGSSQECVGERVGGREDAFVPACTPSTPLHAFLPTHHPRPLTYALLPPPPPLQGWLNAHHMT